MAALLHTVKRCFASLFTDRSTSYRVDKGFDVTGIALSVGVQRMVRSDLACSGVAFTIDTETGFQDVVLINASYGLGENVVRGVVNPDEYCVFKPTLRQGYRPIIQKRLGGKEVKLVYDASDGRMVKNVPVSAADRARFALDDDDVLTLAKWACAIEDHYSAKRGQPTPMDVEWAKDGRTGEMFVVQARPETIQSRRQPGEVKTYRLKERGPVLAKGRSVGDAIAAGPARVISGVHDLGRVQPGDVLVAAKTDPDWEPVMKRAAAIVTNRGGRTCHAAIVSRELGAASNFPSASTCFMASLIDAAQTTGNPARSSACAIARHSSGLSSTTRMRRVFAAGLTDAAIRRKGPTPTPFSQCCRGNRNVSRPDRLSRRPRHGAACRCGLPGIGQ